jgi:hypothetical protein
VDFQVNVENGSITIDNGYYYLELELDQAKDLLKKLEKELYTNRIQESVKKDWKYFGGL